MNENKLNISREQILGILPKNGITAELGVGLGNFSELICSISDPVKHYCIDVWKEISIDIQGTYFASNDEMDKRYELVKKKLSKFNVEIYRDFSCNIINYLDKDTLDWVYIDGDHTYNGCINDLNAVNSLVKDTGYILGHDYCCPKNHQDWGVIEAVSDFVKENKYFLSVVTLEKFPTYIISKNLRSHNDIIEKCKSIEKTSIEVRHSKTHNRSFYWPKFDRVAWKSLHKKHEWNLPQIFSDLCEKRNLVIQAGGNAGLYPYMYSKFFKNVYTFEPDDTNFECLSKNLKNIENVSYFNLALGDSCSTKNLEYNPRWNNSNSGALRITDGDSINVITIDSMNLSPDLIHLDVEGYEGFVIQGAIETIKKYKPMIVLESNDSGIIYDWSQEKINDLLFSLGYTIFTKKYRDIVYTHV